jgi:hypothetical protein
MHLFALDVRLEYGRNSSSPKEVVADDPEYFTGLPFAEQILAGDIVFTFPRPHHSNELLPIINGHS